MIGIVERKLHTNLMRSMTKKSNTANGTKWLEDEKKARRSFIEALKSVIGPVDDTNDVKGDNEK